MKWVWARRFRCLVSDNLQLVIEFQAITLIHTLLTDKYNSAYFRRVLVICPKSVVFTWIAEFSKWLTQIYDNKMPFEVWCATVNTLFNLNCPYVQIHSIVGGSGKRVKDTLE